MNKVAVVYWSGTGNTAAMAQAVAEGANAALLEAAAFTAADLGNYDAVAFGCPAMGAEQLEESEFEPMFAGLEWSLGGKKIALFGSYGWGSGEWMEQWAARCKEDGAVLYDESGLIVNEAPDDEALGAAATWAAPWPPGKGANDVAFSLRFSFFRRAYRPPRSQTQKASAKTDAFCL